MSCYHPCAWVTLLTRPFYLPGVKTLQRSLLKSNSRWPLVVMVTNDVNEDTRQQLRDIECQLYEITPIGPDPSLAHNYTFAHYSEVWNKLAVWTLTEFKRVVFLDADMLVIQNSDELFELTLPDNHIAACHACRCNPHKIDSYPSSWCPDYSFYSWCEDSTMQATPPAALDNYLNSGMMVLEPDSEVYREMLFRLTAITDVSSYFFPEQDFLNDFYYNYNRWLPLHYGYNALKTLSYQHPYLWDLQKIKNIHYILDKPWEKYPQVGDKSYQLDKLWWQYNE